MLFYINQRKNSQASKIFLLRTQRNPIIFTLFLGRTQLQEDNVTLMTFDNRMPWDRGERIYGVWDLRTGLYHCKVEYSITSSLLGLITRLTKTPLPSWQHNLIYILCHGNYEEKNTRPFSGQHGQHSLVYHQIHSISKLDLALALQSAFNASWQEPRTIQELHDFCPLDFQVSLQYYLSDPQFSQTTIQFKSSCALFTHALTVSLTCALP